MTSSLTLIHRGSEEGAWNPFASVSDKAVVSIERTMILIAIALQQCAIVGMGVALLPNWLVEDDFKSGVLVNVFPEYKVAATEFYTAAWLIYASHSYIPLKLHVFMDFIQQTLI